MNPLYPFQQAIVRHGAETLAGLKPASLLCWETDNVAMNEILAYGRHEFARFDIHFTLLGKCGSAYRILIYRSRLLTEWFLRPDVSYALHSLGYRYDTTSDGRIGAERMFSSCRTRGADLVTRLLDQLQERIRLSPSFPDEIGLFLGYPVEDVLRFMEDHGQNAYPLRGSWRVYHRPKQAEATFNAFRACRQCWLKAMQEGCSLPQLIDRVSVAV